MRKIKAKASSRETIKKKNKKKNKKDCRKMYDPPKVVLCDTRQREKREGRQEEGRDRGRKRGKGEAKTSIVSVSSSDPLQCL